MSFNLLGEVLTTRGRRLAAARDALFRMRGPGPLIRLHGRFHDASSPVLHRFEPDFNQEVRRIEILNPEMSV